VVVDFNDQATAPEGETPPSPNVVKCVTVNEGQTAADALNAAGLEVRANDGFVCGINGYPKEECGLEIAATTSDPTAMATAEDMATVDTPADEAKESTNTNLQLIGLAAVLIIAFAVVLKMRKKK
jgi:LPXTG-motif cell wall-anchored protein